MEGEWLEYTISVANNGYYSVVIRSASESQSGEGGGMNIYANGKLLASNVETPYTGGWQTWEDTWINKIYLNKSDTVLKLEFTKPDFNLNYLDFAEWTGIVGNEYENTLALYPNPSDNFMEIKSKSAIGDWSVCSVLGNEILSGTGQLVDVSGLESGIYVLIINGNSLRFVKK